jgi:hypothetical protein
LAVANFLGLLGENMEFKARHYFTLLSGVGLLATSFGCARDTYTVDHASHQAKAAEEIKVEILVKDQRAPAENFNDASSVDAAQLKACNLTKWATTTTTQADIPAMAILRIWVDTKDKLMAADTKDNLMAAALLWVALALLVDLALVVRA